MSLPIDSLPIKPSSIQKLKKAGFINQKSLMGIKPIELSKEIPLDEALFIIKLIRGETDSNKYKQCTINSQSCLTIFEEESQNNSNYIFCMCQPLDNILGGGFQLKQLTEVSGAPGIGKTQLAIQLSCDVQIPKIFGGVEGQAVYLDTEGSFFAERAYSIASSLRKHITKMNICKNNNNYMDIANNFTPKHILSNIFLYRIYSYTELLIIIKNFPNFFKQKETSNIKLIIIDSVAFAFRHDFPDIGLRTKLLTQFALDLQMLAEKYNIAIVIINQITTKIKTGNFVPALGESWSYYCPNRIMLHYNNNNERIATLIKSSSRKTDSCNFIINNQGFRHTNRKRKEPDV